MKNTLFLFLSLSIASNFLFAQDSIPYGWILSGSAPDQYVCGTDTAVNFKGKTSAFIRSDNAKDKEFGTLMQNFKAYHFHGERLMMTAKLRTENVSGWCGIWMRVDNNSGSEIPLGFDNMSDRPVKGTNNWKEYSVVLDVPFNSNKIAFGVLLSGEGMLWFDDVSFERVSIEIPTTGINDAADFPVNLDFEEY